MYVTDLSSLSLVSRLYMYADDVILLKSFQLADSSLITGEINNDLVNIAGWACSNGLHLNPAKSMSMIAGSSLSLSRLQSFDIFLYGIKIEVQSSIKILGVHIDSSWSFEKHVSIKCQAAYMRLRMLFPSYLVYFSKTFSISGSRLVSF